MNHPSDSMSQFSLLQVQQRQILTSCDSVKNPHTSSRCDLIAMTNFPRLNYFEPYCTFEDVFRSSKSFNVQQSWFVKLLKPQSNLMIVELEFSCLALVLVSQKFIYIGRSKCKSDLSFWTNGTTMLWRSLDSSERTVVGKRIPKMRCYLFRAS